MSNGEHEIRTPKGLRIGNRSVVDGKNMIQIKRGGCEDYISAESLVECIHGLPVKSIEFFTKLLMNLSKMSELATSNRSRAVVVWTSVKHLTLKICWVYFHSILISH